MHFLILKSLLLVGMALGSSLIFTSEARAQLFTSMELEKEPRSSELSDPMIEELKQIFEAYESREKKPFSEKWPVRIANWTVRGILPSVGVNLFMPYDPLMPPTLGATFVSRD